MNPPPDNVVPFRRRRDPDSARVRFRLPRWLDRPWLWQTVTGWLVLANVSIWLLMVITSLGSGIITPFPVRTTLTWGSMFPDLVPSQPWRLLTSTFLHANALHLAMNMVILWFLGQRLEAAFGRGRFLLTYLFAGLTGALVSFVWHGMVVGVGSSVGASGAVLGVLGALFVLSYRAVGWDHPLTKQWGFWTLGVLVFGLFLSMGGGGGPIDNAAHIGGWLGGAAIAPLFLGRPRWSSRLERGVVGGGFGLVLLCFVLALGLGRWSVDELPVTSRAPRALRPAVEAFEAKDWPRAERELREAVLNDPRNARLRVMHAAALQELGRDEEARAELLQAADVARDAEILRVIAESLKGYGEIQAARQAVGRARQIDDSPELKALHDELRAMSE